MVLMLSEYGCRTVKVLPGSMVWSLAEQLSENARTVELVFRYGNETLLLEDTLSLREEYGITQQQALRVIHHVIRQTAEEAAEHPALLDIDRILDEAKEAEGCK